MNYFHADAYYSSGYSIGVSENPDVEDPEQPISTLGFLRANSSAPFRPRYEAQSKEGEPAAWIRRGVQDNSASRSLLPGNIVALRAGLKAEKVAHFVTDSNSQAPSINNPDGMYYVGLSGRALELKLFLERDKDGTYAVDAFRIDDGTKMLDGWWYPDTQQFWLKERLVMPGNEQCNQMSEHRWSYSLVSDQRTVAGRSIPQFEESSSFASKRRPRICVNVRLKPQSSEILSCNQYEELPPRFVIVESKTDAVALGRAMKLELDAKCKMVDKGSTFDVQFCP